MKPVTIHIVHSGATIYLATRNQAAAELRQSKEQLNLEMSGSKERVTLTTTFLT